MHIYTVIGTDDEERYPVSHLVVGSYTSRGKALDECVDYIMERIGTREDLAWSIAHDENHPEAAKFFREKPLKDRPHLVNMAVRRGCAKKLREFLRDELGGQSCYYVHDGRNSYHFDIDENDLEGTLWNTVTWGDSDTEDPEFTTPWPEMFTTKEAAISEFEDYVKGLMEARGMDVPEDLVRTIKSKFDNDGMCQIDLEDGCCVSCALYHDSAVNIK